jgi:hypothetical protein
MNNGTKSYLARGNAAFRQKDFVRAVELYKEAIAQAKGPLAEGIRCNLRIATKRAGLVLEKEDSHIEVAKSTELEYADEGDNLQNVMQNIKLYFDSEFYYVKYPDVKEAGLDPLRHYCTVGWRQNRDPRSDFFTADYLELNPDVAAAGINPFWHYVVAGKSEGREFEHPGGIKAKVLQQLTTIGQIVKSWKRNEIEPELLTYTQVTGQIKKRLVSASKALVLSIGHDHYKQNSGGIQLCIQQEERLAVEQEMLYLNVHPWQPLPVLASEKECSDPIVALVLAGKDVGACRSSVLTESMRQIYSELSIDIHIVVHSFLGHATWHLKDWVNLSKDRHCWVWLHDFFTLCPSYALQRNNVSFCGAPDISSNACAICVYGEPRRSHIELIRNFFFEVEITVISPSEAAKEFWLSKNHDLSAKVLVLPHAKLWWLSRKTNTKQERIRPISIAYIGAVLTHKGWPVFERLHQDLSADSRYEFVYFGSQKPPLSGIKFVSTRVTADEPWAMANAISEAGIDFVLHWASCFETFSFTTHEAIAGGSYVITNPYSGNVASVVTKSCYGLVMSDEKELFNFFKDDSAEKMVKVIRKNKVTKGCKMSMSDMTFQFLNKEEVI